MHICYFFESLVHLELCRVPTVNSLKVTNSTGIGTAQDALRLAQLNYNYLFPLGMIITQKNGKHWNWQMIDRNVREKQRNERSRKIIGMVFLDNFQRYTEKFKY